MVAKILSADERSHDALLVLEAAVEDDTPPSTKFMRGTKQSIAMPKQRRRQKNVHPQLDNLYVMVVGKRQRIFPNAATYDIDNDLFSGKMLFMFRTPDVDEPASSFNDPVVNYLRGKQRRFEFQWQFQLKKLPAGDVFMGAELEEPIHMGMIQRALSNGVLKFVEKTNQGITSFLSDSLKSGPSYLSFPVGTSMDRFHAADIGEGPLPVLGQEIPEDAESMKQRKKGAKIEWDTGKVYTMALWSAYFDWLDWQILNFPGIRPFSATSVAGVQPIRMTLFTDEGENGGTGEKKLKRNVIFAMEVSNAAKATLGSEAKKWIEEEEAVVISKNESHHDKGLEAIVEPLELELSDAESNGNETFDEEDLTNIFFLVRSTLRNKCLVT